jgi:hypothetical protein
METTASRIHHPPVPDPDPARPRRRRFPPRAGCRAPEARVRLTWLSKLDSQAISTCPRTHQATGPSGPRAGNPLSINAATTNQLLSGRSQVRVLQGAPFLSSREKLLMDKGNHARPQTGPTSSIGVENRRDNLITWTSVATASGPAGPYGPRVRSDGRQRRRAAAGRFESDVGTEAVG